MHIFGECIRLNIEFCRPNSTSVEKTILPAQSQGSENGYGLGEKDTHVPSIVSGAFVQGTSAGIFNLQLTLFEVFQMSFNVS